MAEFLYQGLVDWFQDQVEKGFLSAGDKMPSLRKLAKEQGLSLNTVIHGYELLVQEGWVEARTKSGYYVCHRSHLRAAVVAASETPLPLSKDQHHFSFERQHRYNKALHSNAFNLFGGELFSIQLANMKPSHPQGELTARQALVGFLSNTGIHSKAEQIWLANRATTLLAQSIQTLTKPAGKILLVTPCDYRLSQIILELGREPVTLAAGDHGADLDAVEAVLSEQDIDMLLIPGQFAFPAGQELTNLNLRRWYALIETHKLPTVEWDMTSHLPNRPHNVMTLKSLDQAGHILYLGGFEGLHDTASLGWLIAGRYEEQLSGPLKAMDMCPGVDQQISLLPLMTQKKHFAAMSRMVWTNAEKVKYRLEELGQGKLSVVVHKGGYSLWVYCETPISQSLWQDYEDTHLNSLIPGELVYYGRDAEHWFVFNLSMTDQLEETFKWLAGIWEEKAAPVAEKENTSADSGKAEKADSGAEEPVYNPMLDMINHDFN